MMIPREPTQAMMDAGLYHSSHDTTWADVNTMWKAMFDAVMLDGGTSIEAPATAPRAAVCINITGGVLQGASANIPLDVYAIDYDDDADAADDENVITLDDDEVVLSQCSAIIDDLPGKVVNASTRADIANQPTEKDDERTATLLNEGYTRAEVKDILAEAAGFEIGKREAR